MLKAGEESYTTLQRASVLFNFALISVIFLWLVRGFILAVVMAAIFAGLAHPLYTRMLTLFRGREVAAALATLIVTLLLVVVPLGFFAQVVAMEAYEIGRSVKPQVSEFIQQLNQPGASLEWIPFWDRLKPLHITVYLLMGWLVIFFWRPFLASVSTGQIRWMFIGGISYTAGVLFYMTKKLTRSHFIWHLFVIAGAAGLYMGIYRFAIPSIIG